MSIRMSTIKWNTIVYALDTKRVLPGHYKKTANQSAPTIVAI